MRRALLVLACLFVITTLVAPAVLLWSALFTTAGLQFVVRHLPQQLGPVRLVISGVSGTVARGLQVERVEIDHRLVHLTFEGIEGRVALRPLLLQTIHVSRGSVRSALIEVKRRTTPSTPGPPSFLPRWLNITVDSGHVGSATLTVYNGFRLAVTDLQGAAVMRHAYIRFFQADGQLEGAHVSAIGELRAQDPLGIQADGHLDWSPAGQPQWTIDGGAHGNLDALIVSGHTLSPFRTAFSGRALDLTSHWHWIADVVVQDFDLQAFGIGSPLGHISGTLSGVGDEHGFEAHGPLNPAGLAAGMFDAQFAGSYAEHVLTARHMQVRHRASGARASGSGTIAIVDHGPRLDLSGNWNDFRWPLIGRAVAVRSTAGTFTLAGVLPYAVHLRGSGQRGAAAGDARRAQRHTGQEQLQLRSGRDRPVRRARQRHWPRGLVAARDLVARRPRHRHQPGRAARGSAGQHRLRFRG